MYVIKITKFFNNLSGDIEKNQYPATTGLNQYWLVIDF